MLQLPHWSWVVLICLTCGAARWKGGDSERAGAAIVFLGWVATVVVQKPGWWEAAGAVIAVDLAMMGAFLWLALRSSRFWPLWAAGFHLLAIATHVARAIDPKSWSWAYATAAVMWGYLTLIALAVGTAGAWRERSQALGVGQARQAGVDTPAGRPTRR